MKKVYLAGLFGSTLESFKDSEFVKTIIGVGEARIAIEDDSNPLKNNYIKVLNHFGEIFNFGFIGMIEVKPEHALEITNYIDKGQRIKEKQFKEILRRNMINHDIFLLSRTKIQHDYIEDKSLGPKYKYYETEERIITGITS
jgi:hypothetical protein